MIIIIMTAWKAHGPLFHNECVMRILKVSMAKCNDNGEQVKKPNNSQLQAPVVAHLFQNMWLSTC